MMRYTVDFSTDMVNWHVSAMFRFEADAENYLIYKRNTGTKTMLWRINPVGDV